MLARRAPAATAFLSRMEEPLLRLSPTDHWRIRDSYESVAIFGAVGSGKTSGSGRAIAHSYLKAGYGGLVLCAMPSERALWEQYAAECGRSNSVIVLDGSGKHRINFLDYELSRSDTDQAKVFNAVRMLTHILDAAAGKGGAETTEKDFWRDSMGQLFTNSIGFLSAAQGKVTLAEIMRFINARPRHINDLGNPAWKAKSYWAQVARAAWEAPARPLHDEDYFAILDWWTDVFLSDDMRTSSNVVATVSSKLSPFLSGKMREIFATHTTIVPELTHEGAIIIVDLPITDWDEAGILAQQLFKYLWQRSVQRREIHDGTRPVFLYADECQYFMNPFDAKFQAIARQKRSSTVYITQNLPTFYDRIGSRHPEHTAHALLGNFQTKIFHANTCKETNHYAAELIGKGVIWRRNIGMGTNEGWQDGWNEGTTDGDSISVSSGSSRSFGTSSGINRSWGSGWSGSKQGWSWNDNYSYAENEGTNSSDSVNRGTSLSRNTGRSRGTSGGTSGGSSRNAGATETIDYHVQPAMFATLKNGGAANGKVVQGLLLQGGRVWEASKSVFLPCSFPQS